MNDRFAGTTGGTLEATLAPENTPERSAGHGKRARGISQRSFYPIRQKLIFAQLAGDVLICFGGLSLGYWLRYISPLRRLGIEVRDPSYRMYLPLLALGTILLIGSYAYLRLYDPRLLLRPFRCILIVLRGNFFWLLIFLSVSLILKFDPPISRIFAATSCVTSALAMVLWRLGFGRWLSSSHLHTRIRQRVAFVGWSSDASRLAGAMSRTDTHPFEIGGVILTSIGGFEVPNGLRVLGELENIGTIIVQNPIDIVVIADSDLPRNRVLVAAAICERNYIELKIIPSFFQVFASNLHMETISGIPILGTADLEVDRLFFRQAKRIIDIIGSIFGLAVGLPIIAAAAVMIRREDPGPVFFSQDRLGRDGRVFRMFKLRTMRIGSEKFDEKSQSTPPNDPRLLSIGRTLRRWSIDEIPQFWNVLCGDMSLVGPRPERIFHADKLAYEIPNYAARHVVMPGMTGWAQISGLRGEGDLDVRIKYDLYYIDNWSLWLDIQILIMTLLRFKSGK